MSSMSPTQPFHEITDWGPEELIACYHKLLNEDQLGWQSCYRKIRRLGTGGQGVVYLSERQGSDQFRLPVALKVFSPKFYRDLEEYVEDMQQIAQIAVRVALIQHDNVLDVHNFMEQDGIRMMVMEWIDGYDLRQLLNRRMLERVWQNVGPDQRDYLNDVIVTPGPVQPRLKAGIALQVLRECLSGLAALHRNGIVHGDLKPSNIMLKRTGNAKIIDMGSAADLHSRAYRRIWSPAYAAPEVLEGTPHSAQSDLASLGYVLIEMLAGQPPFQGLETYAELLAAKQALRERLPEVLPEEIRRNDILMEFCRRLIAVDPAHRFACAEDADLDREGAATLHRQLVLVNLDSEYENDIRVWLEQLG